MTGLSLLFTSGARIACLALACAALPAPTWSQAATPLDTTVVDARDAARKRDRNRLAAARATLQAGKHPLTPWVEYWDLSNRLPEVQADEVEAFYARWPGSYVEDRLRNDWLLELGRRRDWPGLAREYPRFRMADDREVSCWWLFTEHLAGRDVTDAARSAWLAQRELDDGCNLLATAMVDAKRFSADDVWRKARLALEGQRAGAAKAAIGLLAGAAGRDTLGREAAEAIDTPARYLKRGAINNSRNAQELRLLAVMRLAQSDAEGAAAQLDDRQLGLAPALAAWGWAYTGRQAAFKLSAEAAGHYQRALALWADAESRTAAGRRGAEAAPPQWSDETLAWGVRATLRGAVPAQRWPAVLRLI